MCLIKNRITEVLSSITTKQESERLRHFLRESQWDYFAGRGIKKIIETMGLLRTRV